jgi:hypothetical protein
MNLAVIHTVHDRAGWQQALAEDHEYGPGFDLRSFVQAEDGSRALCLWEAPSQAELQQSLDRFFGHAVVNDVFPVEVSFFAGATERT